MKKKVLFIMPSLGGGGAEKSLVTLIQALDGNLYDIHIQLFEKKGIFLSSLPPNVTVMEPVEVLGSFSKPIMESMGSLQRHNRGLMLKRALYTLNLKTRSGKVKQMQKSWKFVNNSVEVQKEEYDAVIGYMEMWPIYFAVEKVNAKVKIGVIHTNYTKYGLDKDFDLPYFNKLDHLLTVSEECRISLVQEFPQMEDKIKIMENIISAKMIAHMAEQGSGFQDDFKGIRLLTIGRLDFNKGYDLAIEACRKLVDKGLNIRWYAIGTGPDKEKFIKMVKVHRLENHFIFLGSVANPYPFLKQADLYVHSSRLEGKSLAVEEAKVLQKSIVVTAYTNVKDQITDGKNGVIVDIDAESLAGGILKLIDEGDTEKNPLYHPASEIPSNEEQVLKVFNGLLEKFLLPS